MRRPGARYLYENQIGAPSLVATRREGLPVLATRLRWIEDLWVCMPWAARSEATASVRARLMSTPNLKERTARAVRAAASAGRELGLDVRKTVILHDLFSVVVHLAPAPVVARVRTVPSPGVPMDVQVARHQRELDVVAWLAERGVPVVAPTPLVPRAPVVRDGFCMTFWTLADLAWNHVAYAAVDTSHVAVLHNALRAYPATHLPFLSTGTNMLLSCLDVLENTPGLLHKADVERLRSEWAAIEPMIATRESFARAPVSPCRRSMAIYLRAT